MFVDWKPLCPMLVTESGIACVPVKPVQPSKASCEIVVKVEVGVNVRLVIPVLPLNAYVPMLVTDEGIVIDVNDEFVHSLNAFEPIPVILVPIVTLVIAVLPLHAFASIVPT